MDNQRNAEVIRIHVSFINVALMVFSFFATSFFVMTTNILLVPKWIILLEGIYFALAYYLRTLDGYGARVLVIGHICSIMTIYTDLKAACILTLTWLTTFYPVYSVLVCMCLFSRFVMSDARELAEFISPDTAECIHVLMMLGYIAYYYIFHFTHKTRQDTPMVMTVLWGLLTIPHISKGAACIMTTVAGLWIEYKSSRLAPLSEFPVRSLVSVSFQR